MGVPGPTLVKISLFSTLSMADPPLFVPYSSDRAGFSCRKPYPQRLSGKRQTTIERIKRHLVELLKYIQPQDIESYTQLG